MTQHIPLSTRLYRYIAHPSAAWPVFLLLTALHVYANYKGTVKHTWIPLCMAMTRASFSFLSAPLFMHTHISSSTRCMCSEALHYQFSESFLVDPRCSLVILILLLCVHTSIVICTKAPFPQGRDVGRWLSSTASP